MTKNFYYLQHSGPLECITSQKESDESNQKFKSLYKIKTLR